MGPRVQGSVVVRFPGGGGGGVTWQPSPRGWWGTIFPGAGQGGGVHFEATRARVWQLQSAWKVRAAAAVRGGGLWGSCSAHGWVVWQQHGAWRAHGAAARSVLGTWGSRVRGGGGGLWGSGTNSVPRPISSPAHLSPWAVCARGWIGIAGLNNFTRHRKLAMCASQAALRPPIHTNPIPPAPSLPVQSLAPFLP